MDQKVTYQLLLTARRFGSHLLGDLFQDGHLGDSCSRVAELWTLEQRRSGITESHLGQNESLTSHSLTSILERGQSLTLMCRELSAALTAISDLCPVPLTTVTSLNPEAGGRGEMSSALSHQLEPAS